MVRCYTVFKENSIVFAGTSISKKSNKQLEIERFFTQFTPETVHFNFERHFKETLLPSWWRCEKRKFGRGSIPPHKEITKMMFRAWAHSLWERVYTRNGANGLTVETSSSLSLHGKNLTLIGWFEIFQPFKVFSLLQFTLIKRSNGVLIKGSMAW